MASSVEMLCRYLCSLRDLHQSVQKCLQMQSTQQALVHHKNWADQELDESVRLLDVIAMTREVIMQMKEHVNDIQLALRRRSGGESDMESKIGAYQSFRKKRKKQIAKHIKHLKRSAATSTPCPHTRVTNALRQATLVAIYFLESLLSFMFISRPETGRKSLVSKWLGTGRVACEEGADAMNEVARVEAALSSLRGKKSPKRKGIEEANYAGKQLEALEVSIRRIQDGLDCLFKSLIKTRVSLLNSLSY